MSQVTCRQKRIYQQPTNKVLLINTNHPKNYYTRNRINETIPSVTITLCHLLCLNNKLGAEYSKPNSGKEKETVHPTKPKDSQTESWCRQKLEKSLKSFQEILFQLSLSYPWHGKPNLQCCMSKKWTNHHLKLIKGYARESTQKVHMIHISFISFSSIKEEQSRGNTYDISSSNISSESEDNSALRRCITKLRSLKYWP